MREKAVLVLDDEEPGELLAELGKALPDEFQAGDDGTDVARIRQLAAAIVRDLVKHRDRSRCLTGDLNRCHGARQFGH